MFTSAIKVVMNHSVWHTILCERHASVSIIWLICIEQI